MMIRGELGFVISFDMHSFIFNIISRCDFDEKELCVILPLLERVM